jgi:hypothetical protein
MLESFRDTHVVGDKGFDSQAFRQEFLEHGAADSAIPRKGYQTLDEKPQPSACENYAKRHLVENFFPTPERLISELPYVPTKPLVHPLSCC